MPFLQSISQDFLAKSLGRKRGTILGGEASIDANYLYIDVKNTGSNTLQVYGNSPIPAEYVIVGGGGGGGWPAFYNYAQGDYYYQSYLENKAYYAGQWPNTGWGFYGVWIGNDYYYTGLNDWGGGRPYIRHSWDGGGGGAGGVLTGSIALNSQSYSMTIGNGGVAGSWNAATNLGTNPTNGGNTVAFGSTALGGGYGGYSDNVPGSSGGSGGGAGGQREGGDGTTGQGNPGSYRGTGGTLDAQGRQNGLVYRQGMDYTTICYLWHCSANYSLYYMFNNGYWRTWDLRGRVLTMPGWGGGAGAPAFGSQVINYYHMQGFMYDHQNRTSPEIRSAIPIGVNSYMTPASLNDRAWSPEYDSTLGANAYTYVETVGAANTQDRMSIWSNVRWGKGVDSLGLKVGGGGMAGINARSISDSYGGGYPVAATTAQGTYSKNGTANTGGGGGGGYRAHGQDVGAGGAGGSGIVRLRIKRSDIGI